MRRRGLLGGAACAGVMLASGVGLPRLAGSADAGPAIRADVSRMSAQRLARLEAAIGEMQRRSGKNPDDPAGWRVHALTHAQVCSAVSNKDDGQVHGCWWFLPWHRAFLAVTEWKLRAVSGDPTLALPYWNWSSDRRIPEAYARPATSLAAALRHTPARELRPAEVDHLLHDPELAGLGVAALGARSFMAYTPEQIPAAFGGIARPNPAAWHGRGRLETVPHGAIHNYAGGEAADGSLGDMTELSTAALDPLFYAHHANLDRLWERWRQDPARRATEPTDVAFTGQPFFFPWLDGSLLSVSVADVMDTRRLGYAYDGLAVFRDGPPVVDLAPRDLPPPLAAETLRWRARMDRCELRIRGVLPSQRPITVEVFIGRPGDPERAISVGAFAIGRRHSEPEYPDTELRFDITSVVRRLGGDAVFCTVVPLPLGAAEVGAPGFVYGGMEIVEGA